MLSAMGEDLVYLTTREVAALFNVNPHTIGRWVDNGRMKAAARAPGYVFTAAEVARVMALPRPKRGGARQRRKQNDRLPLDGVA